MSIKMVLCPKCGAQIAIDDPLVGSNGRCAMCSAHIIFERNGFMEMSEIEISKLLPPPKTWSKKEISDWSGQTIKLAAERGMK